MVLMFSVRRENHVVDYKIYRECTRSFDNDQSSKKEVPVYRSNRGRSCSLTTPKQFPERERDRTQAASHLFIPFHWGYWLHQEPPEPEEDLDTTQLQPGGHIWEKYRSMVVVVFFPAVFDYQRVLYCIYTVHMCIYIVLYIILCMCYVRNYYIKFCDSMLV
jgi:hypothetical protein